MAEALCCPPETITALLIGYTPVQIKSFQKVKKKKIPQYSQYDLRTKEEKKKKKLIRYQLTFNKYLHNYYQYARPILGTLQTLTCLISMAIW